MFRKARALYPALMLMACVLTGCIFDGGEPIAEEDDGIAVLSIKINLLTDNYGTHAYARSRAAADYEKDKWAANDGEKMHTVRIIIVNSAGYVEHNSLWDLTSAPDVAATGQDFPVKADDTKRIVLVANEDGKTIILPDGTKQFASDYFASFSAAAGSYLDVATLHGLIYDAADNKEADGFEGCIESPLPMSAIHEYYIGKDREKYSATFTIHRAAVKYTYRITNIDNVSHKVNKLIVSNIASKQYFFPDADFTDADQYFFTRYRTPAGSGAETLTFNTDLTIPAGETVELPPFYFPEGTVVNADDPYSIAFTFDGYSTGWCPLKWSMPETPEILNDMIDMPRNTHVIVNVSFSFTHLSIDYTVCPWVEKGVVLPPFN